MEKRVIQFGKGQRKPEGTVASGIQPFEGSTSNLAPDSGLRRRCNLSSLHLSRESAGGDQALQGLRAEANRELSTLLRDVRSEPGGGPVSAQQRQPSSELLRRAVRCAMKQYVLQAELGNLALTDELTGLYNRRGFLALAERQLKLGRRSGRGILLFFLDVDGLKQINDTFGHAEGDRTLIRAGGVLEKTFRESDVVARFGGDEFAVLAIEASQHNQEIIAARLRENLREMNDKDSGHAISLSWGVARFDPRSKTSIGQLMVQADQAMYEHKRCQSSSWENVPHPISNCEKWRDPFRSVRKESSGRDSSKAGPIATVLRRACTASIPRPTPPSPLSAKTGAD
jgi:diguanylate cyclase (GGDEF)-like protein